MRRSAIERRPVALAVGLLLASATYATEPVAPAGKESAPPALLEFLGTVPPGAADSGGESAQPASATKPREAAEFTEFLGTPAAKRSAAAKEDSAPTADFLEFLGTVGDADPEFSEFLLQRDPRTAANVRKEAPRDAATK